MPAEQNSICNGLPTYLGKVLQDNPLCLRKGLNPCGSPLVFYLKYNNADLKYSKQLNSDFIKKSNNVQFVYIIWIKYIFQTLSLTLKCCTKDLQLCNLTHKWYWVLYHSAFEELSWSHWLFHQVDADDSLTLTALFQVRCLASQLLRG